MAHYALAYLAAINLAGFLLMAWDKRQARKAGWRVAEKTLLGTAAAGGGVGVYAAIRLLRHKTLHWYFAWGVPAIIAAQLGAAYCFLWR